MPIQSLNPANGRLLRSFEPLNSAALEQKLALAADAALTYPKESVEQRAFWMRRLAALLDHDVEELALTMTLEMGKTLTSARLEVQKCAVCCRYYAEHAARFLTRKTLETEHEQSYVRYDPLGVVLAVMPWNFPLWQVFRFLAPALMAGNVGLLKHASNVPQCALAIEALVRRAGFPRGTFQTLLLEARQVEVVIADERVAAVTVTGSETAGRAIAAQAGWLLKKTVLELGGSDPFIVMPSADFDAAVANAVKARCINAGQSCIAAKRFLVHDEIYNRFEDAFTGLMESLRVGDPQRADTDMGPLASRQMVDDILAQVEAAKAAGGLVLTGGEAMVGEGFYFEPTVIANVPRSAAVCREETFGPLGLLFRVSSVGDAIELANDTPFGLGASAWTRHDGEQRRFIEELGAGCVFINTPVASDPRLPFGGIKRSGYGRELSSAGMREFLNMKTVAVAASSPEPPPQLTIFEEPVAVQEIPLAPLPEPSRPTVVEDQLLTRETTPEGTSIYGLGRRNK
jgi:succinate-semialdehyde dehydrogenase/glutarate-semialdehyde dehydrogenase